ncbi:MAG TPA: peptidoglycan-associated lipoprotein Pal [Rhodocyclaceae bacterium]|nr:peptidoglycan-associated lipoprotein Pal [Rhodocyclaceae bacterium]
MKTALMATAACALLAACSTTPQTKPEAAAAPKAAATPSPVAAGETEAQRLGRIAAALADKSIYFDYDNFAVKSQYQDLVKQDAGQFQSAPQLALRLEGNADERGSTEYNLALGQKRAEAVRRALAVLGVPDARMEAVSYGKERPRAQCHEEKCWAENRRVDLVARKADAAK